MGSRLSTFTIAAGPHWTRTAIVTGTSAYGLWAFIEGIVHKFEPNIILPTFPKIIFTGTALAALIIFWLFRYAHQMRLEGEPKLNLEQIILHISHEINPDRIKQEFLLRIRNTGLQHLSNCIVKIDKIAGVEKYSPTALLTVNHAPGAPARFNLSGGESKDIVLGWATITKGDAFIVMQVPLESGLIHLDPDTESILDIGLYGSAPSWLRLRLRRNEKGRLEVTKLLSA